MKYKISCLVYQHNRDFEGTESEVIAEAERRSEFHCAEHAVYNEDGTKLGQTVLPEPIYKFMKD